MRDRKPVKRTERAATSQLLVSACGVGHRPLSHEGDDGVYARVDPLDLRKVRGHDLASGDLLPTNPRGELDRVQMAEVIPTRQHVHGP